MGEVRSITAGRGAVDISNAHEAPGERLRAATGGAERDVLNKFAADLENWRNLTNLHNRGAPIDPAKRAEARQALYNSYLSVGQRGQARYGESTLRDAQRLAGGKEPFAQGARSAGVDLTRYRVLTSDAVRSRNPKRAGEVLQLAKDVQQEYRHRRDNGLVPDEKLLSLSEELHAYGMQLKHAPGGFLEDGQNRVLALAASPPEMATSGERSELMGSATLDLARGPVNGVYSAGRSVANLLLDVADRAGLKTGVRVPELPETLRPQTVFGRGVGEVTQFAVGFKGADKVLKGLRYREASSWTGATLRTSVQTGLTGFAAFDGTNEWRVSNFVQQQAPNPVTGVLEAKPGDSALAGRIKNGVEGMLFGTAFENARLATGKVAEAVKAGRERQNFTWLFEAVENEVPDLKDPKVMQYLRENTQFLAPDGLPASSNGNVAGGIFAVPYKEGTELPSELFRHTNPEALNYGPAWYIHSIATKAEHQGKGLASQLLRGTVQEARRNGFLNATLEAYEDNATARVLYSRKGFNDVSKWEELPDGVAKWQDGAQGRPFYYMLKTLDETR